MKIIRRSTLPQWIISSDRAAYHLATRTIYIRDDQGLFVLLHEIIHLILDMVGLNRLQTNWDKVSLRIMVYFARVHAAPEATSTEGEGNL